MDRIWANRLIAGTQSWENVPEYQRKNVRAELLRRVAANAITAEQYEAITGEKYEV